MNPDYIFVRGDGDSLTIHWPGKDFTDHTIFFTAKRQPDNDNTDAAAVIKIDVSAASLNGVLDDAVIPFTAAKLTVAPGVYGYDIQIKKAGEDPQTLRIGTITVLPDYTRRVS